MSKDFTDDDAKLLEELGVESKAEETRRYTAHEERILAGFEDIERRALHGARRLASKRVLEA